MAELKLPPLPEPVRINNETGETPCLIRWEADGVKSWVGSYDREAIPELIQADRATMLRAMADFAAQMAQECNPNVPARFPLIDLMNELRAAAEKITAATPPPA